MLLWEAPGKAWCIGAFARQTPLHSAASEGHSETCAVLIGKHAKIDEKPTTGCGMECVDAFEEAPGEAWCFWCRVTPLHSAAFKGHSETCAVLIDKHAKINEKDTNRCGMECVDAFEGGPRRGMVHWCFCQADASAFGSF